MYLEVVVEECKVFGGGGEGRCCLTDEREVMERRQGLMRLGICNNDVKQSISKLVRSRRSE